MLIACRQFFSKYEGSIKIWDMNNVKVEQVGSMSLGSAFMNFRHTRDIIQLDLKAFNERSEYQNRSEWKDGLTAEREMNDLKTVYTIAPSFFRLPGAEHSKGAPISSTLDFAALVFLLMCAFVTNQRWKSGGIWCFILQLFGRQSSPSWWVEHNE